ncbi:MAG: DUF1572 family protein [Chitinophagales bacterium]|nr:DUF1572 family protein [Chitinophagales bacterium]
MEKEFTQSLITQFVDQLDQLIAEINLYDEDGILWKVQNKVTNSAGNLCLHLIGNLNHFIGYGLGSTGYIRERDKEFLDKNVPTEKIISDIQATKKMIASVLDTLDKETLLKPYPHIKIEWTTMYFLIHLNKHLAYHLGQINYHRRFLIK